MQREEMSKMNKKKCAKGKTSHDHKTMPSNMFSSFFKTQ